MVATMGLLSFWRRDDAQANGGGGATPVAADNFNVAPSFLNALEWRFVGPVVGGRSEAVVGDSKHPLVFYFGSAHGGVWKTTDAGIYWRNVSDGFFKTAPVGAIDESLSESRCDLCGYGRKPRSPGYCAGRRRL